MSRSSTTIHQIQTLLRQGAVPPGVDPAVLAEEYAGLCRDTNERLRKCTDFLSGGLLSEALNFAESDPALLEIASHLDFVGVEVWADLCARNGWTAPDTISGDAVQALNEAYTSNAALGPLIKQYRRAARVRDAGKCVRYLRDLKERERDNPSWESSLPGFERQRLTEIRRELDEAGEAEDLVALEEFGAELSAEWAVDRGLVGELRTRVQDLVTRTKEKQAYEAGVMVVERLSGAYSQFDHKGVRGALQDFDRLGEGGFFKPSEEMRTQYEEAESWFREETSQREDDAKFEESLQTAREEMSKRSPDLASLEEAWNTANTFGREIPIELVQRVPVVIGSLRDAEKRKALLKLAGMTVAAVVLLVAIAIPVAQSQYRKVRQRWEAAIDHAYEQQDLQKLRALFRDLEQKHPMLFKSSQISERRAKLPQLEQSLQEIAAGFDTLLRRLETMRAENFANDAPQSVEELLRQAEQYAQKSKGVSEDALARLALLKSEWRTRQLQDQQGVDKKLKEILDRIHARLAKMTPDSMELSRLAQTREAAKQLELDVIEAQKIGDASSHLVDVLNSYVKRTEEIAELIKKKGGEADAMLKASTLTAYMTAVSAFVRAFPDDGLYKDLNAVVDLWQQYKLLVAYTPPGKHGADFHLAKLDQAMQGIAKDNYFWHGVGARVSQHDNTVSKKWDNVARQLKKSVASDLLWDLWRITYSDASRRRRTGFVKGGHEKGTLTVSGTKKPALRGEFYLPGPKDNHPEFIKKALLSRGITEGPVLMEHCVFLRELLEKMDSVAAGEGPAFLMNAIEDLAAATKVPALLRVQLLALLASNCESLVTEQFLPRRLRDLQTAVEDMETEVSWLCVESNKHLLANSRAREIIDKHVPEKGQMLKAYRRELLCDRAALVRGARWLGAASLDPEPRPLLRSRSKPAEVWALRPSEAGSRPFLIVVATLTKDGELQPRAPLFTGEPLFGPAMGGSTLELLGQLHKEAALTEQSMRERTWPHCWPALR